MKVKIIMSCIIMCILILIGVQVNAALDATVSASCNETVEPGETITLDLNLNVTSASQGVEMVMVTVDYPTEVMDMSLGTIPGVTAIQSDNLIITLDDLVSSGSKNIAKLNFKAKENTTATEATIKLTEIEILDGDGTQKDLADITKTVKIEEEEPNPQKTLTSIKITDPKTTIECGKTYELSDLKVIATYSDGSTEDVASKCTYYLDGKEVNGYTNLEKGTHTIKAMYQGKEDSFTLTVIDGNGTGNGAIGTGDKTVSSTSISKAGLEMITIPGIVVSIVIAIVAFKKYNKMF